MIRASHIVLLSCLLANTALAAPERQENTPAASASAQTSLTPAKLKAMPTARLLKLGQSALTADAETSAFTTGLEALKVASFRGDRVATRMLGKVMARHDLPIMENGSARIESRLRHEAMQGASSSVLAIAGMYDRGDGVQTDTKRAAEWYLWAARLGNRRAMANVAYAYGTGRGVARDDAAALKWLKEVNPGRARMTLVDIGWALATGSEGSADMPAALRFFERAAQVGPDVAYQVALDLDRGTKGIRNREAAGHLIRVAAERGDSAAATHLANILSGSDKLEDQRQAVQWYSLAALDKENATAGQGLSRLIALRPQDDLVPGIIAGLEKAVEAGNHEALLGLALAYADGIGVEASPGRAASLLQQAADAGIPEAKYRLSLLYRSGTGVDMDLDKAIELMSSAQESGFPLAAVALSAMVDQPAPNAAPGQSAPTAAGRSTMPR
ncbi:tetratricopeptide repeat protein [Microvirga sp. TS319]|uniref:tetratricopeptide repeat protein n=1 Tax=Microvirga sp. TS319 TaxID=3241165 RepID=UPI00351A0DE4